MCIRDRSKSYRDVVMGVYWDNKVVGNVMCVIWDLVQLFSIVVVSGSCISGSGSVPVSYTHLDVYKRQYLN